MKEQYRGIIGRIVPLRARGEQEERHDEDCIKNTIIEYLATNEARSQLKPGDS